MALRLTLALLASASILSAQDPVGFWDSSIRTGPQFHAYDMKAPLGQRVSQLMIPAFVIVPLTSRFSMDVGTAYATVSVERDDLDASGNPTVVRSELSGLTDTQVRANYTLGQDFVVLTAGVNIPTGSATVAPEEIEAAAVIGSDFLTFPVSGFGTGLGFTGGAAIARPVGPWNLGFGASVRHSMEYEPGFRNTTGGSVKFQPGAEYRARVGADHPFGTGRVTLGFTFSKFGNDRADTSVYNTGDRYIAQVAVANSALGADYTVAVWNLYRAGGTLIDNSPAARDNITNALVAVGVRAGMVRIEPSLEARAWVREGTAASTLGTVGVRFHVNRDGWAIVPGGGYTIGRLAAGSTSASLTGFRATLGVRFGR